MQIKRTKRCEQELSKECLWNEGLRDVMGVMPLSPSAWEQPRS
jgi:hypothetical protein